MRVRQMAAAAVLAGLLATTAVYAHQMLAIYISCDGLFGWDWCWPF